MSDSMFQSQYCTTDAGGTWAQNHFVPLVQNKSEGINLSSNSTPDKHVNTQSLPNNSVSSPNLSESDFVVNPNKLSSWTHNTETLTKSSSIDLTDDNFPSLPTKDLSPISTPKTNNCKSNLSLKTSNSQNNGQNKLHL